MAASTHPRLPKDLLDSMGEVYNQKAAAYELMSRCQDHGDRILKTLVRDTDFRDKVVLELGAGTGRFALPLARLARTIHASDLSDAMLGVLRAKAKAKGIRNVKTQCASYEKVTLPPASVDIVTSFWSFPAHSADWNRDFQRIDRMLKPGGKIILVDTHHDCEVNRIAKKISPPDQYESLQEFGRRKHAWLLSQGFRGKLVNTLVEFGSKRNVEKACPPFFGFELATYLLARDRTSFQIKVSVFSRTK